MGFAREVADDVVIFDKGDIVEVGSPEEIFTNSRTERTKTFLSRVLRDTDEMKKALNLPS